MTRNKMIEENKVPEMFDLLPCREIKDTRFSVQVVPEDKESSCLRMAPGDFDPFNDRKIHNPTSDFQTLIHLLKSTLGSGIMGMPMAFKNAGLIGGIIGGLFTAAICTHTSYILVDCAHVLYYKTKQKKMDYPDVMEAAFATGPEITRKFSKYVRYTVLIGIFITYFGACSADNLVIATNYSQIIKYYMEYHSSHNVTAASELAMAEDENNKNLMKIIMGCLLPPLIFFVWVPDLKYLAPISTVANVFMAIVIILTLYYIVPDPMPINELQLFQPSEFPKFFALTLFAMANIGVMMPLENSMKTPQNLLGTCGVLNKGMFGVTIVYLLIGVFGYMKYGAEVNVIITANLPVTDIPAQIVKALIGTTVLLTFSLQFYVCREMAWNSIKEYFPNHSFVAEYVLRAVLVIVCVSIAVVFPLIGPLDILIGAVGFSLLGIIGPAIIETITYWDEGFGRFNWKLYKNIVLIVLGILAICFGILEAIPEIKKEF